MLNIFLTVFFSTLAFAFLEPFFFIGYLISIALFGLYQAIFMANAGGAWDNAKKIVEVELKMKGRRCMRRPGPDGCRGRGADVARDGERPPARACTGTTRSSRSSASTPARPTSASA